MEELLWLCALAGLISLTMRWLLFRGLSPMSQQAIRQLFVERLLTMQCRQTTCTIYFEALYRRCLEAPHRTMLYVRQAVQAVVGAVGDEDGLPADWMDRTMPLLFNEEIPTPPDLLRRPLTQELHIGYVINGEEAFRWITRGDLERAGVEVEHLHTIALRNLERSCNSLVIETPPPLTDGRDRMLRFRTLDGLDAARVLLPSFYRRFAPRFGDVNLLVAIPTRDELVVIPATDQAQASFLQWRLDTERRRSPRPLTGKLLHLTTEHIDEWVPGEHDVEEPV